MSLLFGDLLSVTLGDLLVIYSGAGIAILLLASIWKSLISITVEPDLAAVDGVKVARVRTALMLITALVIAIAMKIVGVLLITALLIIPAAAARRMSSTPETMAVFASLIAMLAVVSGLGASWYIDTPAGPSIVISATLVFCLSLGLKQKG